MTDEARLQRWLNGQRRSHQRTFQSRELVWQSFESLAREQGASVDQLIGEAMEAYASARGYNVPDDPPAQEDDRWAAPAMLEREEATQHRERDPLDETHDAPQLTPLDRSYMPPAPAPAPAPIQNRKSPFSSERGWDDDNDLARTELRVAARRSTERGGLPTRPPIDDIREPGDESRTAPRYGRTGANPPVTTSSVPIPAAISRPVPTPAFGTMASRGARPVQPPLQPPNVGRPPMPPPQVAPPPPQAAPPPPPQKSPVLRDTGSNPVAKRLSESGSNPGAAKRLILTHRGQTVEVEKERFLLGRSKTQADMRLDDPNVSRQHAVIERVGTAYFIVDLGSTNGIYVSGERVARRALADGDLIVITSHEIRCALR